MDDEPNVFAPDQRRQNRRVSRVAMERVSQYRARAMNADGSRRPWTAAERKARERARRRLGKVAAYRERRRGPYVAPDIAPPSADALAPLSTTLLDQLKDMLP